MVKDTKSFLNVIKYLKILNHQMKLKVGLPTMFFRKNIDKKMTL